MTFDKKGTTVTKKKKTESSTGQEELSKSVKGKTKSKFFFLVLIDIILSC